MPSFVVVSPPAWVDCKDLHEYLVGRTDFKPSKCVLEFGKSGDHPHLNYVCMDDPSYVSIMEDLETYVKTLYYPCGQRRRMTATMRSHILRIRDIYDSVMLDAYLSKEEGCEVLPCPDDREVDVEWEFSWREPLKGETFAHHLLINLRAWLANYPIVQTLHILTSHSKYEKEVRRMLFSTGHGGLLLKYNGMRYDQRQAILITLRTELKITDPID